MRRRASKNFSLASNMSGSSWSKTESLQGNRENTSETENFMIAASDQLALLEKQQELLRESTQTSILQTRIVLINSSEVDRGIKFSNKVVTHNLQLFGLLSNLFWAHLYRFPAIWYLVLSFFMVFTVIWEVELFAWDVIVIYITFIVLTIIKFLRQNIRRSKENSKTNERSCLLLNKARKKLVKVAWGNIRVGNILRIYEEEFIPADLIMLNCGGHDAAYFETSTVDGVLFEKPKYPVEDTRAIITLEKLCSIRGRILCSAPGVFNGDFTGSFKLDDRPRSVALSNANFICKGSRVKKVPYIDGVVVYTELDKYLSGQQSRITKQSLMDFLFSLYLLFSGGVLLIFLIVSSVLHFSSKNSSRYNQKSAPEVQAVPFYNFLLFCVQYRRFFPLTIFIAIDIIRLIHTKIIEMDTYFKELNEGDVKAQNLELNESLGQVDFLLTDKTGTITENFMELKYCIVGECTYGPNSFPKDFFNRANAGNKFLDENMPEFPSKLEQSLSSLSGAYSYTSECSVFDNDRFIMEDLENPGELQKNLDEFWMGVLICNNVKFNALETELEETFGHKKIDPPSYQCDSPEELCLVSSAEKLGFKILTKSSQRVTLFSPCFSQTLSYKVIFFQPFVSLRRRMSIAVRSVENKKTYLYCKGAVDVMMKKIAFSSASEAEFVKKQMKAISEKGIRVLVLAKKKLSRAELSTIERINQEGMTGVLKEEYFDYVIGNFENNMQFVGVIGLQTVLSEGVNETFKLMMEAGIRIWVLTGDDENNTKATACSSGLLLNETNFIRGDFHGRSRHGFFKKLSEVRDSIQLLRSKKIQTCLGMNGDDIAMFFSNNMKEFFLEISTGCEVFLAFKVTPAQKAMINRVIKGYISPSPTTMAVGDGLNDIQMLAEADIGVGILNKYTIQELGVADYILPKFHFLSKLMFVHGRLNYMRVSTVYCWQFLTTSLIGVSVFFNGFFDSWSSSDLFGWPASVLYTIIWTIAPIAAYSLIEYDLPLQLLLHVPVVYIMGRRRAYFNFYRFMLYFFEGAIFSLSGYIYFKMAFSSGDQSIRMKNAGYNSFGLMLLLNALICGYVKLITDTKSFTKFKITATIVVCSVLAFLSFYVLNMILGDGYQLNVQKVFLWAPFWLTTFLCVITAVLVDTFFQFLYKSFFRDVAASICEFHNFKIKEGFSKEVARLKTREYFNPINHTLEVSKYLPISRKFRIKTSISLNKTFFKRIALEGARSDGSWFVSSGETGHDFFARKSRESHIGLSKANAIYTEDTQSSCFMANESQETVSISSRFSKGEKNFFFSNKKGYSGKSMLSFQDGANTIGSLERIKTSTHYRPANQPLKENLEELDLPVNLLSQKFLDANLEEDYQAFKKHNMQSFVKAYRNHVLLLALLLVLNVFLTPYFVDIKNFKVLVFASLPNLLAALVYIFSYSTYLFIHKFDFIISVFTFIALIGTLAMGVELGIDAIQIGMIYPILLFLVFKIPFFSACLQCILFLVAIGIQSSALYSIQAIDCKNACVDSSYAFLNIVIKECYCVYTTLTQLPIIIGVHALAALVSYRMEYTARKNFFLSYQLELTSNIQKEILNVLLPEFVVEKMVGNSLSTAKSKIGTIAEDCGVISVIFCDIYDFQKMVASVEPIQLVRILDLIFLCFDQCAEHFNCMKIETVFDCYLCASGIQKDSGKIEASTKDAAFEAMQMGLAMLQISMLINYKPSRRVEQSKNEEALTPADFLSKKKNFPVASEALQRICIKIGIHTGRVISGVVGSKKPQFALFGDTVNIASRMKETGAPDKIHVSFTTHQQVEEVEQFVWQRRDTSVKGMGLMSTYLLKEVTDSKNVKHFTDELNSRVLHNKSKFSIFIAGNDNSFKPGSDHSEASNIEKYIAKTLSESIKMDEDTGEYKLCGGFEEDEIGKDAKKLEFDDDADKDFEFDTKISAFSAPGQSASFKAKEAMHTQSLDLFIDEKDLEKAEKSLMQSQIFFASYISRRKGRRFSKNYLTELYPATYKYSGIYLHTDPELKLRNRLLVEKEQKHHKKISREKKKKKTFSRRFHHSRKHQTDEDQQLVFTWHPVFQESIRHSSELEPKNNREIKQANTHGGGSTASKAASLRKSKPILAKKAASPSKNTRINNAKINSNVRSKSLRRGLQIFNAVRSSDFDFYEQSYARSGESKAESVDGIFSIYNDDDGIFKSTSMKEKNQQEGFGEKKKTSEVYEKKRFSSRKFAGVISEVIASVSRHPTTQNSYFKSMTLKKLKRRKKNLNEGGEMSLDFKENALDKKTEQKLEAVNIQEMETHPDDSSKPKDESSTLKTPAKFFTGCYERVQNFFKTKESNLGMHWFFLTFKDDSIEEQFNHNFFFTKTHISTMEQGILLFLIFMSMQITVIMLVDRVTPTGVHLQANTVVTWIVASVFFVCTFFLWILISFREEPILSIRISLRWTVLTVNIFFTVAGMVFVMSNTWGYVQTGSQAFWNSTDTLILYFFVIFLNHNSRMIFKHMIWVNLLLLGLSEFLLFLIVKDSSSKAMVQIVVPVFVLASSISSHLREYVERRTYLISIETTSIELRRKELLRDMLPNQVLEEFQKDKLELAYKHEHMSFLFSDICGFTAWSKSVDAEEVIKLLRNLFSKFDRDTTHLGIYKLCTIGDAYVCVSEPITSKIRGEDPIIGAVKVYQMAQLMLKNISIVRKNLNFPDLEMRIGLHHGSCVGGLIGSGRLRYDIWGTDVLIGNKIESNGIPGQICCSEAYMDFINLHPRGNALTFNLVKQISVSGNPVNIYQLEEMSKPNRFRKLNTTKEFLQGQNVEAA